MTGPRTAKMLLPYPRIILGCRPCERLVALRQGDRCKCSPGTCLVTYNDQFVKSEGSNKSGVAYLILTSSNGTTTKLSVAPALQPVMIESCLVISASPARVLNVFPQKSFDALSRDHYVRLQHKAVKDTHNFVARLGASRSNGGTRPFDSKFGQTSHSEKDCCLPR